MTVLLNVDTIAYVSILAAIAVLIILATRKPK